jgi:predicted amidohydrolase YtcJ
LTCHDPRYSRSLRPSHQARLRLTVDPERTVHPDGAIAITGSIISAVGPDAEITARYSTSRVINARGAPVHPGMIDLRVHTTTHLSRTASRTIRQSTHRAVRRLVLAAVSFRG